jgi:hypothetical protein
MILGGYPVRLGGSAMHEPKDLLLANEQLRRSNRRWKALALAACAAPAFVLLLGFMAVFMAQDRANRQLREANAALARANFQAAKAAAQAASPVAPAR